jgi:hypothetical protein
MNIYVILFNFISDHHLIYLNICSNLHEYILILFENMPHSCHTAAHCRTAAHYRTAAHCHTAAHCRTAAHYRTAAHCHTAADRRAHCRIATLPQALPHTAAAHTATHWQCACGRVWLTGSACSSVQQCAPVRQCAYLQINSK